MIMQAQNIFYSLKQTGDTAPAFHAPYIRSYTFHEEIQVYTVSMPGPVRSEFYIFSPVRSVWSGPKNIPSLCILAYWSCVAKRHFL